MLATNLTRRKGFKSAFMAMALGVILSTAAATLQFSPAPAAADAVNPRPSAYVLAVGVDQYSPGVGVNNLKGCENDATNLASRMKDQAGGLFGSVDTRILLSKDATGNGIKK